MGNRNKSKAKPAAQAFSLAGWAFLVLDGPKILARGQIATTQGNSHLIQFGGNPPFFRMLSNEALEEGSLFPTQANADEFLQNYMQQFQPAAPATPDVDPEVAERADANGFTIEEQLQADAEAEAHEIAGSSTEGVEVSADEVSGD